MTNILSKRFIVHINDAKRGKTLTQTFENNMEIVHPPVILPYKGSTNSTRITFKPDLVRFGYPSSTTTLDDATVSLLERRVVDMAASLGSFGVRVYLNDTKLPISSFQEYLSRIPSFTGVPPPDLNQQAAGAGKGGKGGKKAKSKAKEAESDDFDDADADEEGENGTSADHEVIYADLGKGWEIAVGVRPDHDIPSSSSDHHHHGGGGGGGGASGGGLRHISFVNSIATSRGGTHVAIVADQIARHVSTWMNEPRRAKKLELMPGAEVHPGIVKAKMAVFVSCLVANPTFDSQTKDTLTTPLQVPGLLMSTSSLGTGAAARAQAQSVPEIPTSVLNKIVRSSGIVEAVAETMRARAERETRRTLSQMSKRTGRKQNLSIEKLDDANLAGTSRSHECTLILTEGDSAKALAVAGLAVVGRERYGVYPLKGKLLNVRDAPLTQVQNNKELMEVAEILGLRHGESYATAQEQRALRYGSVMIMADQDHDGSHIKGLVLNMLHCFWPGLVRSNCFVKAFATPIIKATPVTHQAKENRSTSSSSSTGKGGASANAKGGILSFYSLPEYLKWKNSLSPAELKKYRIKYYKGLGTSSAAEGREYFSNLDTHVISFNYTNKADDDALDLAFNKTRADHRKDWLLAYNPAKALMQAKNKMTLHDFVHSELIQFSIADTTRSIPSLMDGLKPGQRKVLFGCFKRNLTREIRVSQLAGYVSEHTGYHHGEASLHGTITNMAQDYVGANNLPLLQGVGQFGTRHMGGKDAASPRYIFTALQPLTRKLFRPEDDFVLRYRDDDGLPVEPYYYAPVLPMVLINGAEGIGTGFSTSLPTYHPIDVANNVRRRLSHKPMVPMVPWTWGFKGQVIQDESRPRYSTHGILTQLSPTTVEITELPWGTWTSAYKTFLASLLDDDVASSSSSSASKSKGKAKSDNSNKAKRTKEPEKLAKARERRMLTITGFTEHHTEDGVKFRVTMDPEELEHVKNEYGLEKAFKLVTYLSVSNIHLFDSQQRIKPFDDLRQVIDEYVPVRLGIVQERKAYLLERLRTAALRASNRMRFISEVMNGDLVLAKKKKAVIVEELRAAKYVPFPIVGAGGSSTSTSTSTSSRNGPNGKKQGGVTGGSDDNIEGLEGGEAVLSYEDTLAMMSSESSSSSSSSAASSSSVSSLGIAAIPEADILSSIVTAVTGSLSVKPLATPIGSGAGAGTASAEDDANVKNATDYDYLLNLPFTSMTEERVNALGVEISTLEQQIKDLENSTAEQLWLRELDEVETILKQEKRIAPPPKPVVAPQ